MHVFPTGRALCGVATRDDTVDMCGFVCVGQERTWFLRVTEALVHAAVDSNGAHDWLDTDDDGSAPTFAHAATDSRSPDDGDGGDVDDMPPFHISSVSFNAVDHGDIAADIDGVRVTLSCNRLADVCHGALCEAATAAVGKDCLFKRSLVLIQVATVPFVRCFAQVPNSPPPRLRPQAWCYTRTECGPTVLTWRLLVALTNWLFLRRRHVIHQPLQALMWFILDVASFDWTR